MKRLTRLVLAAVRSVAGAMAQAQAYPTQPLMYQGKLPFDPLTDFSPVGMVSRLPFVIAVLQRIVAEQKSYAAGLASK
ncbi:MAG: hypothetical protein ACREXV_19110 [Polaromonas sp.]